MKKKYGLFLVLLAGILLFTFSTSLVAQSSENMTLLGNWGQGGGEIRAVSNFGDLDYYGLGNVLKIVSFEDPENPYAAGSVILDDMVEDIVWTTITGQTYCLISGTSLNIVNVTNPITPSLVATLPLSGYGEGLAVSGTYAYIAAGGSGMEVIDISDPANPTSVKVVAGAGSGYAEGVNVSPPYAYLANGANFSIMDISTPTNPTLLGSYENSGGEWIQDVSVISNFAYACAYGVGIDVVNISNPAAPAYVTTLSNPKNADIMFDGNNGYIASREYGLTVIDVSTPSTPTIINTFLTDGILRKVSFGAITMDTQQIGHIFTAEVSAIGAVNVSDPAGGMSYSGKVSVLPPADGIAYSSLVNGNTAYVAYGDFGVRILDVSNPGNITELGNYETGGSSRKIVMKDDVAFVANRAGGVLVLDVANTAAPESLTTLTGGTVNDVALSGNYVYAAARDLGIAIINATTANAPTLVTSLSDFYGEGVAADGNVMGQSTWDKIILYDISSPEAPVLSDSITLATGTGEFAIDGDYLYVHDFDTLRIYDISTLTNAVALGKAYTGGSWDGTAFVAGDYAYANAETNGIRVFDITDKSNPTEVAHYDGSASARGVYVVDGMVYVAEKENGLTVYRNDLLSSIEKTAGFLHSFTLEQNYPNPFNPTTTIKYSVPHGYDNVKLAIYNTLGQSIVTLVNTKQPAGTYQIVWDGRLKSGILAPSGIYLYKLSIGNQVVAKKMTLVK
jgi:hypothetical protein